MYELNKVGEHTYYINCPTNIGVYEYGGKVCFIDSGGDARSAEEALLRIEEQGWTLDMIINTHCHADHCYGNAYLQKMTGCRIYAPKTDSAIINNTRINPTYLFGGFPCEELHHRLLLAEPSDCGVISPDVLPEGLSYTHLDGHSYEMIAVHTDDDVWFLADIVIGEKMMQGFRVSFLMNVGEHLKSLDKLQTLNGRLFIPAHCEPTEDIAPLAELNRANVAEVSYAIKELCKDGLSIDELIERLFLRYAIKPHIINYALAGCAVRSYLSWLHNGNEMELTFDGAKLIWKTM